MIFKAKTTYQILKSKPKKGLELMYKKYGAQLCAYAIKSWNLSEDEAWELIYKTMFKIEKNIEKYEFKNEDKFAAFLYKIFINQLRNYYRDQKTKQVEIATLENEANIEDKNEQRSESESVKQLNILLDKLEDWQRMLLLLRAQDMPYSEIAKYIDRPEKQLKVYYQRLKQKIEKQLKEQFKQKAEKEVVYE